MRTQEFKVIVQSNSPIPIPLGWLLTFMKRMKLSMFRAHIEDPSTFALPPDSKLKLMIFVETTETKRKI